MAAPLRIVIFGLTVSSSWANGHATLWRALLRALRARGHHVTFFERDVPYYAAHRDLTQLDGHVLCLYGDWSSVQTTALSEVESADAAIVTSYCPDAQAASDLICSSRNPIKIFYDLDTPVTLASLRRGRSVEYVPTGGLAAFDLVLSFGGGPALDELRDRLGAKKVAPLYGSVDPSAYQRTSDCSLYRSHVTYLGTYADDRQAALDKLFLEPARRRPDLRFLLGGSMYPSDFPWTSNLYYVQHVPPPEHPKFYSSCRLTVNVTRGPMAAMGFCPSGRLFEAAACGTPVLSDRWPGLESFFEPGREILVADSAEDAIDALDRSPAELEAIGHRARTRALASHSADRRAQELEHLLVSM
jgi:spore maturation protein CgeB